MYRMKIGCTIYGGPLIGAGAVNAACEAGTLAATEYVYPSQFAHRCAARMRDRGWLLMTPTEAERDPDCISWRIFPRANGEFRRGY